MNRSQEILNILAKRRPLADKVKQVQEQLESVRAVVNGFQQYMNSISQNMDQDGRSRLESLQEQCANISGSLNAELSNLEKLRARFSRSTLNIGVIGRARQGKSRLLQSLTGLGTEEIPSGDRTDCTGVRSMIRNHQGEVEAKIRFYRSSEFLDFVIGPYYEKLGLGVRPMNLDTFGGTPVPDLPENKKESAVAKSHYEYLLRYQKHLGQYRHLLGEEPRTIKRNSIRSFVAQSSTDASEEYYNFFAVRDVEIHCPFAASDVSGIALIDTPGLGDTGVGSEDRLLKTLAEEVDLILFVRRPSVGGDSWKDTDTHLYDTCANAVTEIPIGEWAFMVLNRTMPESGLGDNSLNCEDVLRQIGEKGSRFAQTLIADCSTPETAKNEILDNALAFLTEKIVRLDLRYTSGRQEQLSVLRNRLRSMLKQAEARQVFGDMGFSINEEQFFLDSFETAWKKTLHHFDLLMGELLKTRDIPNANFEKGIQAVVEEAHSDTGIPDVEEIHLIKSDEGSWDGAFDSLLQKVRAHLSYKFLGMDEFLRTSTEKAKSRVSDIFREQANFSGLTDKSGTDFLLELGKICDVPGYDFRLMQEALFILANFRISFRGFLQHRVRKQLDCLTPDISEYKEWAAKDPVRDAETLQKYLTVAHKDALEKIEQALKEFTIEPNQAIFAIVEEFTDRAFRAEHVKKQWQVFFRINRARIWPEQFKEIAEGTALREKWDRFLHDIENSSKENLWKI